MKSIKLVCYLLLCLAVLVGVTACDKGTAPLDTTAPVTDAPTEAETAPDVSGVTFADQTVIYDGTTHALAVEALPEGVTVVYKNESAKDAGEYAATATLSWNGEELAVLSATLTVTPREITVTLSDGYFRQNDTAALTYTAEGVAEGDDLAVTVTADTSVLGAHTAAAVWNNPNYAVTFTGGSYTVTETVFDSSQLANYSSAYLPEYAPFCLYNTTVFSGQIITSISFPYGGLAEGYTVASEGLYVPVFVVKSDLTSTQHDCTPENGKKVLLDLTGKLDEVAVGDWITVDGLSIEVAADETLAFGDPAMTVLPLFLRDNGTHGFYNKVFTDKGANNHSLILKVEGYPTKPTAEDGGKLNISFLGDSISTYNGWSNSTSFNSTIGNNVIWYPHNNNPGADMSVSKTWWYRTATEGGYSLCVNNSWSGSLASDANTYNVRAKNLHNTTTGESPDIIVILIGVNDWSANTAVGNFDGTVKAPTTPSSFSEAYGRMIAVMQKTYPDAKIYCCTFLPDRLRSFNEKNGAGISEKVYNDAIRTIAQNMGVGLIDLYADSGITPDNITTYTTDRLHPNADGMELMAKAILKVIGENIAD